MDFKRAPDPGVEPPTEIERLPSAPFTLPSGPAFEHVWLGRTAAHGELFGGRYELGERLRVGATGERFAATHVAVQRRVAIQVLRPELARDPAARQRFERSALALAAIDHRNIVHVFDLDLGDPPFVALELPAGPSLAELIARDGPLEPTRAVRIALQLAAALRTAHACGVVHGAVRADNVVLCPGEDDDDVAKLVDFTLVHPPSDVTVGTPDVGDGDLDLVLTIERADGIPGDLYALASLLHHMLVGPDPRAFEPARLRARLLHERAPVSADALCRVIGRGLARAPRSRFESAARLEEALRYAVSPAVSPRSRRRARPVRRFLIISLAAVVISGLIAFWWGRHHAAHDDVESWDERGSP
jgi:serine/threonine-protein kinase